MPTIVGLENDSASVCVYTEKKMVHHVFKKYIYGDALRAALSTGAELMEKHKATKWLSDDRNNAALSKADSDWAAGVWFPRAKAAGWKTWAIVLPRMTIGKMNMQMFIDQYQQQGIQVRVFDDPAEAMTWLESVKD